MFSALDPPKNYKITINTWTKDAHALFDYESDSINSICVSFGRGGKIYRDEKKNEAKYEKDSEDNGFFLTGSNSASSSNDCLVNFYNEYGTRIRLSKNIENEYEYNKNNIILIQEKQYFLVEQIEFKGIRKEYYSNFKFKPRINDIIRFGRVQFIVRDMKDNSTQKKDDDDENLKSIYLPNDNNNLGKNLTCKICKKGESDIIENPIIKVCKCNKSPFFHLNCFKEFLKKEKDFGFNETEYTNGTMKIIIVYNFLCPFCSEPYNPIIIKNNKEYDILPYSYKKNDYYIILESLNFIKENIFTSMIIVFTFPKKTEEYFLGRGHEASFKVSDISISRVHSKFYIKNGNIYIDDLGSKFGTLVLIRKDVDLNQIVDKKIKIQTGRTTLWIDENNK